MHHDTTKKTFNYRKFLDKNGLALLVGVILVGLFIWWMATLGGSDHRSEMYKKTTGAAGLNATIAYDCKKNCSKNQRFDFNVYIFKDNGQQVSVVRPDTDGKVNLALAEGNYVMVVGKLFGADKVFPQEAIKLKNGQSLELKLDYKE